MLFAGITILIFFFFVVQKQRALSKDALAEKILTDLQGLFAGASVSTGSVNYFETPQVEFEFRCDPGTCTEYGCGEASFSMPGYSNIKKSLNTQPLFSPGSIKGYSMTVVTKSWNVPFRAINFVYITNPDVAYVIVHDGTPTQTSIANKLNSLLPEQTIEQNKVTKRVIVKSIVGNVLTSVGEIGQSQMKIILIDTSTAGIPTKLNSLRTQLENSGAKKISAVSVSPNADFAGSGSVRFFTFDKEANKWTDDGTSYYVDEVAFLGAIYAENRDNYECNMMKALAAFSQVSKLYERRRAALSAVAEAEDNDACKAAYNSAGILMNSLISLKKTNKPIPISPSTMDEIYESGIEENKKSISSLADYNARLEIKSCPLIY